MALTLLAYPAGYLLGGLYQPLAREDAWTQTAVRLLLGLAVWPVLIAASSVLGLRFTGPAVAGYVAVTALAALAVAMRRAATSTRSPAGTVNLTPQPPSLRRACPEPIEGKVEAETPLLAGEGCPPPPLLSGKGPEVRSPLPSSPTSGRGAGGEGSSLHNLALPIILTATLALRCWQVRDVAWPLWGDAVNHTAATVLILEHGGIPPNWEPFIPTSQTFSYHFGFHSWAAAICWLTPVEPWWAVFWTERFLSVLTPLSLYLLAVVLFRDRRVGIGAALASGLLTIMPQYYVNWSRDPQLGGQVLLPLLAYCALATAQRPSHRVRAAILLALSVAGLVFVHYRVLVFAAGLFCGLAILILDREVRTWKQLLLPGGAVAAGLAIGAPWIWHVLTVQRQVTALAPVSYAQGYVDAYFGPPPLWEYVSPWVLAVAILGTMAGMVRWRRQVLALAIWLVFLLLAANGYRTGRSSLSLITYISVYMALYLPLSLGVGMALEALLRHRPRSQIVERRILGGVVLLALPVGFLLHGDIIDDTYVLVRPNDVRAFDWIRAHTPPEARFLINSFSASGEGGVVVGSDAGWWLPLATGRSASVPVINYGTEVVSPQYVDQVRRLSALSAHPTSPEARRAFCEAGITHVFVGSVGGPIPAEALLSHPSFRLIHQDGGALVFALDCFP